MGMTRLQSLHSVLRQVTATVRRRSLLHPGATALVAVSGGADSVCLLALLQEMRERALLPGIVLRIAHVNYGLRGDESEGDETFVRALGATLGVPVSCERVCLVPASGTTLQSRARDARYAWFTRLLQEYGTMSVATGHTADDQAETVLLWLMRGAGMSGLAGIPAKRTMADGTSIIRPLLGVTRQQVLEYLTFRGLSYRSDSSNNQLRYRRNRIRREVVPVLRAMNPRIVEVLARGADLLSADASWLDEIEGERWRVVAKDTALGRVALDSVLLAAEPLAMQRRLVKRALAVARGRATGLTFRHVNDILERVLAGAQGVGLNLPGGLRVERHRALIVMEHGG